MINLVFSNKKEYEKVIKLFYEYVLEKRDLKHFFFGISFDKLVNDQFLYQHFTIDKPDRFYKESILQTAPTEIQVKLPQFDEILYALRMILEKEGYQKNLIPKVAVNIIEIMEETRAQNADTTVKIWKSFEINKEIINDFYNKNRTDSRIEKNEDIYISNGLLIPTWTRIVKDKLKIIFIAQSFASSVSIPIERFYEFRDQLNEKIKCMNFQVRESNIGPVLFARHELSYEFGIPTRMFMRAMRVFASNYESGIRLDVNELLKVKKT